MELIAAGPVEAWKAASSHLLVKGGEDYHLRLDFPAVAVTDLAPLTQYDPRSILGVDFDLSRDVANTVFPAKTWNKSADRPDFYARYGRANGRRRHGRWGTYFQRMISFGTERVNQLERVIHALNSWHNNPKAALYMHLSSASTDTLRPIGSPCLQYVQFTCSRAGSVSLSAVYRNHDYCNKVLGNLFGLNRLLAFVASQTGRVPDRISVLSIHAYHDSSRKQQKLLAQID